MVELRVVTILKEEPRVAESLSQVPVERWEQFRDRVSAMIKARRIDPTVVNWELVKEMYDYSLNWDLQKIKSQILMF